MKNYTDLQEIITITGKAPVECSCDHCANMCRRCPCLGTPKDILTLIENGYIDNLTPTTWAAGIFVGIAPIEMVQLTHKKDGSCSLFKDGLCTIHTLGLKPTEGKLALHSNSPNPSNAHVSIAVAKSWQNPKNTETIVQICAALKEHYKKQDNAK